MESNKWPVSADVDSARLPISPRRRCQGVPSPFYALWLCGSYAWLADLTVVAARLARTGPNFLYFRYSIATRVPPLHRNCGSSYIAHDLLSKWIE